MLRSVYGPRVANQTSFWVPLGGVQSAGPSVVGALIIRPAVAAIATAGLWGGVRHAIGRDPARSFWRVWAALYLALLAWDTVPFVVQLAVQQAPVHHPAHVEDVAAALTWVYGVHTATFF